MKSKKAAFSIPSDVPQGFILSDSGMYSYMDQDVFPDILSFITAIPDHLKPLFLIPVKIDNIASKFASDGMVHLAMRVASTRMADGLTPSGDTPEGDYFGTETFVYNDQEPTVPSSEPGSIFDIDGADNITHHQDLELNQDQNDQSGTDTSYMSDVDLTDSYIKYPYRTEEHPLRHSAIIPRMVGRHVALKPYELETKTPEKIKDNANTCSVSLVSYDKRNRVYTFSVGCDGSNHTVQAKLNDKEHVALNCDCEFWRWNGPEYHAKSNNYLLGAPNGTASPPDIRDPDRQFHLCKHTYAVTARIDEFVEEVADEHPEATDEEIMDDIHNEWDRMEGVAEVDLEEAQENDVDADIEEEGIELDGDSDEAVDDGDEDDLGEDEDEDTDPDLEDIAESVAEPESDDEEDEDFDDEEPQDDLADIAESVAEENEEATEDVIDNAQEETEEEEDK